MSRRQPRKDFPFPPPLLPPLERPSSTTRKPPKPSSSPYRRTPPRGMTADRMERIPAAPKSLSLPPGRVPSSDWRTQAMRGLGLQQAAQNAASQGYTMDEVANMLNQYSAGGGGGGGGGRGGRGGGGGGGGAGGGGGLSKKDIDAAIKAITVANVAAQESIKGIYANADRTLADLTAEYAAAQAALGAGAGRTLGAFGVTGQQLNPVGMTPQDYLTTTRGTLTGLSAAEVARLKQLEAAYPLLAADLLKNV